MKHTLWRERTLKIVRLVNSLTVRRRMNDFNQPITGLVLPAAVLTPKYYHLEVPDTVRDCILAFIIILPSVCVCHRDNVNLHGNVNTT